MKAKRRLTDMDFSKEGAHVSLVTKKVGGPANGRTVLKLMSLENEEHMEVEMIEKAAHEALVQKAVEVALEPVQKALDAANEELLVLKAEKIEAQAQVKKQALAAVIGEDNPELNAEFEVLKGLDEKTFEIVLKAKKEAVAAVEKGMFFKEVGASGEAVAKAEESPEMRILKKSLNK